MRRVGCSAASKYCSTSKSNKHKHRVAQATRTEQHKQSSTSLALEVCHRETDNCICLAGPCLSSPLFSDILLTVLHSSNVYVYCHCPGFKNTDCTQLLFLLLIAQRLGGWTGPHLWDLGLMFQCVEPDMGGSFVLFLHTGRPRIS